MTVTTIAVAGAGQMGAGVAQVAALAGFDVFVYDIKAEFCDRARERIAGFLEKDVSKGRLDAGVRDAAVGRIRYTTSLADLAPVGLVVEAIVENSEVKRRLFADLDGICGPEAIFTSNTSSIPIIELAIATKRPERFAGLHFFNPVPMMGLIELIRSIATSDETVAELRAVGERFGKTVVEAPDAAGFIVNRLLIPYLYDAIRLYEARAATREDIDNAMRLGCNHPMGPLTLSDFIGLDTLAAIGDVLYGELREPRFAPPPLLRRLVQAGRLGKKAGRGFYEYQR